jgi:hypothetical protein
MRAERLKEIKEAVEGLDTGKYHGADMVAEALVEMAGHARDLIEELEEIREKNKFLIGDRVAMEALDPEDENEPRTGEVIGFASGGALLIRPDEGEYADSETDLWYMDSNVERIE